MTKYNFFNTIVEMVEFINKQEISPQHIVSINQTTFGGGWYLFYYWGPTKEFNV